MFLFFTCWACSLMGVYSFPRWCFYPEEAPCIPQRGLEPLFTGVRGIEILRTSSIRRSRKFTARTSCTDYENMPCGRCAKCPMLATVVALYNRRGFSWLRLWGKESRSVEEKGSFLPLTPRRRVSLSAFGRIAPLQRKS